MTKKEDIMPTLERTRAELGGEQRLYKFPNGYGASVIKGYGTYGNEKGLWELAVVELGRKSDWDFKITYSTPITSDVEGYLTPAKVQKLLRKIQALEAREW